MFKCNRLEWLFQSDQDFVVMFRSRQTQNHKKHIKHKHYGVFMLPESFVSVIIWCSVKEQLCFERNCTLFHQHSVTIKSESMWNQSERTTPIIALFLFSTNSVVCSPTVFYFYLFIYSHQLKLLHSVIRKIRKSEPKQSSCQVWKTPPQNLPQTPDSMRRFDVVHNYPRSPLWTVI